MKWLAGLAIALVVAVLVGAGGVLYGLYYFGRGLPEYQQLATYQPPVVTRVHAGDGRLLAEYAVERRVFVPIEAIPKRVINAVLSAEDKNFYQHFGIDPFGIARAAIRNLINLGRNRRLQGASTITQQVAKNFLLSNEVSYKRKIKEAILALRIERVLSKDRILELYLNEIYLGLGSYGVAAAALNYFNKSLDELTLAETAYLAALPKAPNNYNPRRNPEAARTRRDWVIDRMRADGFVSAEEARAAKAEPLRVRRRDPTEFVRADYFTEEVRRRLFDLYGEESLYQGGLSVRTTVDPTLQAAGEAALRAGLEAYDRRHGWRGPVARIALGDGWPARLAAVAAPSDPEGWRLAVVTDLAPDAARLGFADGGVGDISLKELRWARKWRPNQRVGPKIKRPQDVLAPGDVVFVEALDAGDADKGGGAAPLYALRQIPDVGGALVAMDPHTGRVLAMVGGYDFATSQFNRATQAMRQPGSAFKPIVYMAALDHGMTPATIVDDAPIVIDPGDGQPKWKPANYSTKFYGRTPLRVGIEKSRNLMTVRLARAVGMKTIADYATRLGVVDRLEPYLPLSLGAGETTLLRLVTAYAMIVNGGKRVKPSLIERIQDRAGGTVYRRDSRPCPGCRDVAWEGQPPPRVPDRRERVLGADTAYQMVSMLRGVVKRGTGRRLRDLGIPLAGKTGTTNDDVDAWFIGFSPDLVAGVFVGFDKPRTLGYKETGSRVAIPVFKRFIIKALGDKPAIPFRVPPGVRLVRIDAETGLLPGPGTRRVILEAFKPGTEPSSSVPNDESRADGLY